MTIWVKRLLIANIVAFLLSNLYPVAFQLGALVPVLILHRPWTPITYMFLHGGFMHLLFNMIGLFFFGPRLEQRIGSGDFLWLYAAGGLVAAGFSFLFARDAAVVGASGAVFGVLYGFAHFWPDEPIYIWGVLPVPAKWLVIGLMAIALYSGVAEAGAGIAHFAHIGGVVGGWLYLRWRARRVRKPKGTSDSMSRLQRIADEVRRESQRWDGIRVEDLHEINRSEVVRLKEKMKQQGVSSLSADERAFLDRMAGK